VYPSWLIQTSLQVLPYAGFLALQGIMNSVVASAAISDITGVPQKLNRSLIAQGVANVFCGALAALPIGVSPSQSVVAARMRGINAVVPVLSSVVLLAGVLAFGQFLLYTPVVVLAGLLLTAGIGLIDRWTRGLALLVARRGTTQHEVKWNLAIVAAVAGAFFFGSVPLALLTGTVLAAILLAISFSTATQFLSRPGSQVSSTRVWPSKQAAWLVEARSSIRVLRPHGGLFFGTAQQLDAQLGALKDGVRYCVIDCSGLTVLDATGCRIVASGARKLAARGVVTVLAGVDATQPRDAALIDLGLVMPSPKTHWFPDLDHALEWVETELLREQWPDVATDEPLDLGATSLARGLSDAELQILQSRVETVDLEAGAVLFESGATGRATYIVGSGLVEIRQWADAAGGRARRLAVFGPGGVFGEIAMLTGHPRTADAICVKAARVHELGQDAFKALEIDYPNLFTKVVANLNLHLATRLMVATDARQAR
jgi:anti-anti-sigma regulatory factor